MAYRDDKDALLARTEALDRENERLRSDLDSASDERNDLRAKVAANDRELAKLRKRLAKHERPESERKKRRMIAMFAAAGVFVVAGAVVALTLPKGHEAAEVKQPTPAKPAKQVATTHPKTPGGAPEAVVRDPALDEYNAVYTIRWCMDRTDLGLRAILLHDEVSERTRLRSTFGSSERQEAEQCAAELDNLMTSVEYPELPAYREALLVLLPVVTELFRYYEEEDFADDDYAGAKTAVAAMKRAGAAYVEASDALRAAYLPAFLRARGARADRLRTTSPTGLPMWQAVANANDLVDALFATELSFEHLDQLMSTIEAFRADHRDLDYDRAITFYKFAKRLHRALRERPERRLVADDIHELHMLISYYHMARFAPEGPSHLETLP